MHVHPEIAALRSDPASQRRAQKRMRQARADWLSLEDTRLIAQDLELYGAGEPLPNCGHLNELLTSPAAAKNLTALWEHLFLGALSDERLGEVPHHYSSSAGLSNIRLMEYGRAGLNILAYEQRTISSPSMPPMPRTALFADRECRELVLTGSAAGTLHRRTAGRTGRCAIVTDHVRWIAGDTIELTGADQTRQVLHVEGTMVILQLSRTAEKPGPSQEYRLSDGQLLQSASGDKLASQRLMALAVLGAAQSDKALPVMKAAALNQSEDADVRWEAVRQALCVDVGGGIELLERLHSDHEDRLSVLARDLLGSLISANPLLADYCERAD